MKERKGSRCEYNNPAQSFQHCAIYPLMIVIQVLLLACSSRTRVRLSRGATIVLYKAIVSHGREPKSTTIIVSTRRTITISLRGRTTLSLRHVTTGTTIGTLMSDSGIRSLALGFLVSTTRRTDARSSSTLIDIVNPFANHRRNSRIRSNDLVSRRQLSRRAGLRNLRHHQLLQVLHHLLKLLDLILQCRGPVRMVLKRLIAIHLELPHLLVKIGGHIVLLSEHLRERSFHVFHLELAFFRLLVQGSEKLIMLCGHALEDLAFMLLHEGGKPSGEVLHVSVGKVEVRNDVAAIVGAHFAELDRRAGDHGRRHLLRGEGETVGRQGAAVARANLNVAAGIWDLVTGAELRAWLEVEGTRDHARRLVVHVVIEFGFGGREVIQLPGEPERVWTRLRVTAATLWAVGLGAIGAGSGGWFTVFSHCIDMIDSSDSVEGAGVLSLQAGVSNVGVE